jgi:Ulp1 family protease
VTQDCLAVSVSLLQLSTRLFVYPFTGYGGITVSTADEARLDDGEFLNDNVIDFYMKW